MASTRSSVLRAGVVAGAALSMATPPSLPAHADSGDSPPRRCRRGQWANTGTGEPYAFITPGCVTLMCPPSASVDAGAVIVQRSRTCADGRKWEFVRRNGGEMIRDKATGLCLTDAGVPNGSRREVRQLPCTGASGQAVDQPLT